LCGGDGFGFWYWRTERQVFSWVVEISFGVSNLMEKVTWDVVGMAGDG